MKYSGRTKAFALALSMLMSIQLGMPVPSAVAMEANDTQTADSQTVGEGLPADGLPVDEGEPAEEESQSEADEQQQSEVAHGEATDAEPAIDDKTTVDDDDEAALDALSTDDAEPTDDAESTDDAEQALEEEASAEEEAVAEATDDQNAQVVDAITTQAADTSGQITSGDLTVSGLSAKKELLIRRYADGSSDSAYVDISIAGTNASGTLTVTSSNPSVIAVEDYYKQYAVYSGYDGSCWFTVEALGSATITIKYTPEAGQSSSVSFRAVSYPGYATGITAAKASNTKVKVSWKAFAGATGYRVYSESYDWGTGKSTYTLVQTITNASQTSANVLAPWGEWLDYCVFPYLTVSGTTYSDNPGDYYAESAGVSLEYPTYSKPTIKKAAYNKITLSWSKVAGVTGYKVARSTLDEWGYDSGDYKVIATIKGDATTSTTLSAEWGKGYSYWVYPYLVISGKTYQSEDPTYDKVESYTLAKPKVRISSVKKAAAKKLKVAWTAEKGVTSYKLYRSTKENTGYKLLSTKKGSATSHTCTATPGVIYYFKVVAIYGSAGNVTSATVAQQIAVTGNKSEASKAQSAGIPGLGAWYNARYLCSYVQGSSTYVAYVKNRTLTVITYNKNFEQTAKKKVKLDKYGVFGGIYHGPDNNNYVVTGFSNSKESKKKTVIKVTKYSSKWKKGKVATIAGGVSNLFEGIYMPFVASDVAMDMQGSTLYLETGRTMFQADDGLHHQSNIGFSINTKTMKAKEDNISYASHSFGQRVRFKDGTLYVADHGDAYPRAMQLTWQEGFGTAAADYAQSINTFEIMGATGNNYTGATLGGMEVSGSTVLLCGASVPQGYAVKGVKGDSYDYKRNLYVTVTNRATGKNQVKWLTTYHPKKKVGVGDVGMVKLSDSRFGILYTVEKNDKSTVHYMVINASGKKMFDRTIKGAAFDGSVQPAFVNGRVVWAAPNSSYKGKLFSIQAL